MSSIKRIVIGIVILLTSWALGGILFLWITGRAALEIAGKFDEGGLTATLVVMRVIRIIWAGIATWLLTRVGRVFYWNMTIKEKGGEDGEQW